jgi:hypothetical protein
MQIGFLGKEIIERERENNCLNLYKIPVCYTLSNV